MRILNLANLLNFGEFYACASNSNSREVCCARLSLRVTHSKDVIRVRPNGTKYALFKYFVGGKITNVRV